MKPKWTDYLEDDVYNRLLNCSNVKEDLRKLTNARWLWMRKNGYEVLGYHMSDAFEFISDLLFSNSQGHLILSLTEDEWNELMKQ